MKIIHTADIHLDRSYAAIGLPPGRGNENRTHLQAVLQKILQRASNWPADAVVIAGDLFEEERITRSTINALRDALSALDNVPVLICPGQFDAVVPGSPYLTEQWPRNVHCFRNMAWEAVELPRVPLTIHGFGWTTDHHDGTMPGELEIPNDGRVHLAFGYALGDNLVQGDAGAPTRFESEPTLPPGLAYLGLGGCHLTRQVEGAVPIWYPGAPESQDFDQPGPHHFLEVEITQTGAAPAVTVTPRPLSSGRFHSITLDCTGLSSGQELMDAIREQSGPDRQHRYVRVNLEGRLLRQIYDEMAGIREALDEEIGYVQWHDRCQVAEDYDAIAREHTSLGAFIARISTEVEDAPTQAVRRQRERSRDLGLCAYRNTSLPIRGLTGDYR